MEMVKWTMKVNSLSLWLGIFKCFCHMYWMFSSCRVCDSDDRKQVTAS